MIEEQTEAKRGPGRPPKTEDKMFAVKILKGTAPGQSKYEVVGYWEPEYFRNTSAGKEKVPAEWMAGVEHPPPYPGVGTATKKIWPGTIIKVEREHAKHLVSKKIAERYDDFDED